MGLTGSIHKDYFLVRQEQAGIAINESDISGKRFVYRAAGRRSMRLILRADHRLEGAPSINEHSWEIENGKLVLRHRAGHPTVELTTSDGEHFTGTDLTTSPPEKARLSPDWRKIFGPLNTLVREVRYTLRADKRPAPLLLSQAVLMQNSVAVRIGSKTIRWIFPFAGVKRFMAQTILPWALPGCAVLTGETPTDFVIGVYLNEATTTTSFADMPGQKFLLSVEKETRHPKIANCHSFVQNPQPGDDATYIRYSPTLCCWVPPRNTAKTRKCSVVDNGQYAWRVEMIRDLARQVGDVDIFGKLSGRPLGGYHRSSDSTFGNDKYLGIENHCFYLALERAVADDYITEKFTDAVLCEAVPIYDGAGNIDTYCHPDAYIRASEIGNIDWNNWRSEYERRRPAVEAQKELIRARLNVFSYFHLLTEDLSLLDKTRPITR